MPGLDSETRAMILDAPRAYSGHRLTPDCCRRLEQKDEFSRDILAGMGQLGVLGCIPAFIRSRIRRGRPFHRAVRCQQRAAPPP